MRPVLHILRQYALSVSAAVLACLLLPGCDDVPDLSEITERREEVPQLEPACAGVTIPPNIAPINFRILEDGTAFLAVLAAQGGEQVCVGSGDGRICFPAGSWTSLLERARGGELVLNIAVRNAEGHWQGYLPVTINVAREEIDPYLVYRLITPQYNVWWDVGVYQRCLESFDQVSVLHGDKFGQGCTNCHAFSGGNPEMMSIATRANQRSPYKSACIVVRNGRTTTLDTPWGYTSWDSTGRYAAYSLNKVRQFFHRAGAEVRDVIDLDSEIAVYDAEKGEVFTAPPIADPDRMETYPCWAPDGKTLYFSSSPIPWEDRDRMVPKEYRDVRYDLCRVSFDSATRTFSGLETVLSADAVGKSILLPRVSPDGRSLVCCFTDYGCFPIYQPSSDLWIVDLETGDFRELPVNSDQSESYHSWSSNGRWLVFSSKRGTGVFTRSYISYVDEEGHFHAPFILPQKNPDFYDTYLKTFTVPEFTRGPLRIGSRQLGKAARTRDRVSVVLPVTTMSPDKTKKASADASSGPWQSAGSVRQK